MPKEVKIAEIIGHAMNGDYVEYKVKNGAGDVKMYTDWEFETRREEKLLNEYREKVTKQKDDPDAEYSVDKIITHRVVDGYPLYLVQWEGWPNAVSRSELWEDDLKNCKSLLAEYKKKAFPKKVTSTPKKASRKRPPSEEPTTSSSKTPKSKPAPKAAKKAKRTSEDVDDDLEGIEECHEITPEPVEPATPSRLFGMFSAVKKSLGW